MGSQFEELSCGDEFVSPCYDKSLNYETLFNDEDPSTQLPEPISSNFNSSSGSNPGFESSDDSEPDDVLKYISQMLMDDDMDEKPYMLYDDLALQAIEKPFYDVLEKKYDDHSWDSTNDFDGNNCNFGSNNSVDPMMVLGGEKNKLSNESTVASLGFRTSMNVFSDRESMILFQKGFEEASKFLPKNNNFVMNLENMTFPNVTNEDKKGEHSLDGSRVRKVHYREDDEEIEHSRSSKQSAHIIEEVELSEMFDRVLIFPPGKHEAHCTMGLDSEEGSCLKVDPSKGKDNKPCRRKQNNEKNAVDLGALLLLCAQSTASDDHRTANKVLKQIKEHCSAVGDGSQRLAHVFVNALEARLAGIGSQIYTALSSKRITATDMIKAHQFSFRVCPFEKMCIVFANHMILKTAEKASKLHVIDFGIGYGFQWPLLIQRLSERPGGPPKLCITAIDIPQPGFRPTERVEATGCRLARYCERFEVPFEYHAIAQKWETIKIDDLRIESDEVVVVNSLHHFKNLLDESIMVDSPRNTVLNLIRRIKPDIFLHGIVNGSYSSPFFINRFRDALFHYSTLFDMLDNNASRDDPERLMFEEFYGNEIMNVVACEGTERVERPETHKQWKIRNCREGFRQLALDQGLVKKLECKVKADYHQDFVVDVDGDWILLGWKGRLTYAISAWIPA